MIDHVSLAVADLKVATAFYGAVLEPLGMALLIDRHDRAGFGKKYPELWLNARPDMAPVAADTGAHICLRAPSEDAVRAFHRLGLAQGGADDRAPGPYPGERVEYFGAFLKDPEGNRIEAATFPR